MNYLPGYEPINKKIIFDKITEIIFNKTPFGYAYDRGDIYEINFSDRSYTSYGVCIIQIQILLNYIESDDILKSIESKLKLKIPYNLSVPKLSFLCSSTYRDKCTRYAFWYKLDKDEILIYTKKHQNGLVFPDIL